MKHIAKKLCFIGLFTSASSSLLASPEGGHGFDPVMFAAQVLNFLVFFGGLFYVLRVPIANFFRDREKRIRDDLALAEKSREEATQRLNEIERKMASLDQELADIEAQAKQDAEKERARLELQAKQDAERILTQATAEVENARREAVMELKTFVAQLAVEEAEKVIKSSMTEAQRQKLFVDFTKRLGAQS